MKYYEVHRTQTCKAVFSPEPYYYYNKDVQRFNTVADVKKWLRSEYGTCKRSKIYRDVAEVTLVVNEDEGVTGAKHVGYVYKYNSPKASYDDTPKNNEDWIEVREINATIVIVK